MSESGSYNFLSKFGNQVSPLSVVDFIRIWRHYDTDKSGFIETDNKEDGSNEFKDFVKDFLQVGSMEMHVMKIHNPLVFFYYNQ